MLRSISFLFLLALQTPVCGQQKQVGKPSIPDIKRFFQVSLFPGISSNGNSSGSYQNVISLNLFCGLSAGNKFLEIGSISNVNLKRATGIQLAGLANVVGANAFVNLTLAEIRSRYKNNEEIEFNFQGIQVAGMMNYVRDHAGGIQLAGLLNVVGGDLKGIQIAGIGNSSGNSTLTYSEGVQLAGLYNVSKRSIGGAQISGLFNYTDGALSGLQLGLINKAHLMYGNHTLPPTSAQSLQVGLLNFSQDMDGIQIGLINFGKRALGTQIGLINFFSNYPTKEDVKRGTPIGILNFGSKGSVIRASFSDLFPISIEYTTGNCWNCSANLSELPFHENNTIYNQSPLIIGYNPIDKTWGFGWGVERILLNKHSMLPIDKLNNTRMISYGVNFLKMNRGSGLDMAFNLIGRLHAEIGKKYGGRFIYVGGALNYFVHDPDVNASEFHINSAVFSAGRLFGYKAEFWPGYSVGIQL